MNKMSAYHKSYMFDWVIMDFCKTSDKPTSIHIFMKSMMYPSSENRFIRSRFGSLAKDRYLSRNYRGCYTFCKPMFTIQKWALIRIGLINKFMKFVHEEFHMFGRDNYPFSIVKDPVNGRYIIVSGEKRDRFLPLRLSYPKSYEGVISKREYAFITAVLKQFALGGVHVNNYFIRQNGIEQLPFGDNHEAIITIAYHSGLVTNRDMKNYVKNHNDMSYLGY